eukprot:GHVU01213950.1.p1 GENE.GHVU01213950.1~~GHVU01213950.1.p1  ORF type:complete len:431 (+),score=46.80 GHVU01213950.1:76-1368(+)
MKTVLVIIFVLVPACFGEFLPFADIACTASRPRNYSQLNGDFISPNYPSNYPVSLDCQWQITSPTNNCPVRLDFDDFGTEACCDIVTIYDGVGLDSGKVLARYYGSTTPPSTFSTETSMTVVFVTDGSVSDKGFHAKYNTDPACRLSGGVTYTGSAGTSGVFESPYHDLHYSKNEQCTWKIQAGYNEIISLNFTTFALESNCNNDYVEIYAGTTMLDRICGTGSPPEYFSTGDIAEMTVIFVSNGAIENKGFRVAWEIELAPTPVPTTADSTATTGYFDHANFDIVLIIPMNGTAYTADGRTITPTCLTAYEEKMKNRGNNMVLLMNDFHVGVTHCLYGAPYFGLFGVDVILITLGDEASVRLDFRMPAVWAKTFGQAHQCGRDIQPFMQDHMNWIRPIIETPPGCPALNFNPESFDPQEITWHCLAGNE